ncbi:MAG: RNA polymerase subunit sigma [Myxococcales bacterium]|nr:RNA polymerase subunit sigma [Myxococcales bacterium]
MTGEADEGAVSDALARACERARSLLVVTGAGVSLASGIPTFRGSDAGAVWAQDIMELGTNEFFRRDPVTSWLWYLRRFGGLEGAAPNPAHRAIAALERWQVERDRAFLLVTQNVDGLHRRAGSQRVVEVHGRADRVRCSRVRCEKGAPDGWIPRAEIDQERFLEAPSLETLPRCPACGEILRQHVLWFDEYYTGHSDYEIERALRGAKAASVVLFVGTSFAVGITDMILERALARGRAIFSIDPSGRSPHRAVEVLAEAAEAALPELCRRLGVDPDAGEAGASGSEPA